MIGRQIARYRIVEQIGSGGMSVVYKGVDTSLEREVAVKVLHPHLASKEESRRRFSREARAVAKLHHPNILEIFDFSGDEAPESFIVTEYIRGTTLRAFAEKQHFHPPEIAAMAVHELASALEHAHALGIIHRDLKPENVMIREDGIIKLMDFGIARIVDRDERMTMTGALVGSPAHMAPEIIEGQEAGREADIFSLGTILYWLCCRKLPFLGNNTTQTLKLVLEGTFEDPRISNPAVSDELAAVIARCLARDPMARYAGAAELRDALADCLARAGVERPGEEFVAFFGDPDGFRPRFEKRLVDRLLADAERCTGGAERNLARALDCLNRVLALQPQNERARQLLDAMKRRRRRTKQLAIAGGAAAAVALLAVAGTLAWQHGADGSHPAAPAGTVEPGANAKPTVSTPVRPTGPGQPGEGQAANGAGTAGTPTAGTPAPGTPPAGNPGAGAAASDTSTSANSGASSAGSTTSSRPDPKGDKATTPDRPKTTDGGKKVAAVTPGVGRPAASAEPRNVVIKFMPPHYARIFLDGQLVNENRPWFEGPATPGRHQLRIESGSCIPYAGEIIVPSDGPAVPPFVIKLERKPALLSIKSALRDAIVMVNGTFRGSAGDSERDPIAVPLPESRVKGTVTVALTHEGHLARELVVEVAAGETKVLPVELEKL